MACHLRGLVFHGYPDGLVWANGLDDSRCRFLLDSEFAAWIWTI